MGEIVERMLDSAPAYYIQSQVYKGIQQAQADDYESVDAKNKDLQDQLYIPTATWGLRYWEEALGLTVKLMDSYDVRRSRVLGLWRGIGNFSAEMLEAVAKAFTPYGVHVRILVPSNLVIVVFDEDLPENMADFKKRALDIIHAHLGLHYRVKIKRKDRIDITQKPKANVVISFHTVPWNKDDTVLKYNGDAEYDGEYFYTGGKDDFGPINTTWPKVRLKAIRSLTPAQGLTSLLKAAVGSLVSIKQRPINYIRMVGYSGRGATFNGRYYFDGTVDFDPSFVDHTGSMRVIKNGTVMEVMQL